MAKSIRIRTTPNGDDNFIKINLEQDFDFVEILSLKISQKELYTKFCSDYGAIVGRVIVNNGFGVPNAKVSVFVPVSDIDQLDPEISGLYPFETIADTDIDGIRYNLLPSGNDTNNDCFTPVGTFPDKRQFLDNDDMLDIYCEYYKFTTTTNEAGDYMIFGVPSGAHIMYVEADMSDIGVISQKPYDYIRRGSSEENFDSTTKFRREDNMDSMNNIINRSPVGVNVEPFWGDEDNCNVMITRRDIDLQVNVIPHAIFMGSIFGDNEENSINLKCHARKSIGILNGQTTGSGKIEMIRQTVEGAVERYDVKGGQVIDKDGTWAYQIPMNLDYRITDEYGDLVPSDDPRKGLPTKSNVRFRIGMDITGGEGRLRTRGKFLVPHNPEQLNVGAPTPEYPNGSPGVDFHFGSETHVSQYHTLEWNTIYTIKQFVPRYEHTQTPSNNQVRTFVGIKDVDSARGKYTPYPFNHLNVESSSLFQFICGLVLALAGILIMINLLIIVPINFIINVINGFINFFGGSSIAYVSCVTLKCDNRRFAPGCLHCQSDANLTGNCWGCEAAGGNGNGNTACVGSDPDNDWNETEPLGDAGYTQCVALSLLESENLLKFDFYNDWVNGALYSPLFKYRDEVEDGGEERFCEWSCGGGGVNNNPDIPYDNDCYDDTYMIWTCGEGCDSGNLHGIKQTSSNRMIEGIIEKNDGTLYYAPYSRTIGRHILATDIVTLGSSVKCHWKGLPYVFDIFPTTTYNMPPLLAEYFPDPTNLNMNLEFVDGIDSVSSLVEDSLFIDVNCINYEQSYAQQCGNLRRQCEFGVGLDQYRDINGTITPVDHKLTNNDIDYRFGRNIFAWMNNYDLNTTNSDPTLVDADWNGNPTCGNQIGMTDYNIFRYGTSNQQTYKQASGYETKDSFYFYFGLNRASTAIQKMKEKYFAPCLIDDKPDFVIIGNVQNNIDINNPDGEIDITIVGGTAPFTYTWTYPNGDVHIIEDPNSPDIDGLIGGTYTLTVTDGGGLSVTTTFVVQDPIVLNCFTSGSFATFGNDDAFINVFITGGMGQFVVDIENTSTTAVDNYTNVNGPSEVFGGYGVGIYNVTVTDSLGATSLCGQIEITEPPALTFGVNGVTEPLVILGAGNPTCTGLANGYLNITPSGGTPPYQVVVEGPANYDVTGFTHTGLVDGLYVVTITDSGGQSIVHNYILYDQDPPVLVNGDVTSITHESGGGGNGSFIITLPTSPPYPEYNNYTWYLNGQPELGGTNQVTFNNLVDGDYDVYFVGDGCPSNPITVTINPP